VLDERNGMHVRTGGSGDRTFALVHGIGASSVYFRPLAEELAKHGRVFLLELPGHGKNFEPRHPLSMAEFAEASWRAFDRFDAGQPMIVGHSMGCQVAVEMGIQRPDGPAVALLAPTVNNAEHSVPLQGLRLLQDTAREPWGVNGIITRDYLRCGVPWWLKTLKEMMAHRIEERAALLERDVVIVGGERDPIAPPEWLHRLGARFRSARVVVVHGAPHVMMYTNPAVVARILLEGALP
jgi:pimeloyl-ACP methyl ester carboxylesterase